MIKEVIASEFENISPEENGKETLITAEYLKKNTSINGWIIFFLINVLMGGIISGLYPIVTFDFEEYSGSYLLATTDIYLGLIFLFLSGITIYSFLQRKPYSVFLAKTYLLAVFLTNLCLIFVGEFEDSGYGSLKQVIRALIWSVVWFFYMKNSKKLKELIPIEYRLVRPQYYYITITVIVIPVFLYVLGFVEIYNKSQYVENEEILTLIQDEEIEDGEYTDGLIIFQCPVGFSLEKQYDQESGITTHYLSDTDGTCLIIYSFLGGKLSSQEFEDAWESWKPEEFSDCEDDIEIYKDGNINTFHYYYKATRFVTKEYGALWRYVVLSDPSTEKSCVISGFSYGDDEESYLTTLMNTIRFNSDYNEPHADGVYSED